MNIRTSLFVVGLLLLGIKLGFAEVVSSGNGNEIFGPMDLNSDGAISKDEWTGPARIYDRFDSNGDGQLDAIEQKAAMERYGDRLRAKMGGKGRGGMSRDKTGLMNGPDMGPKVGEQAKDFTLRYLKQKGTLKLSEYYKDKPVALIFGSFTCPPFRNAISSIDEVYEKYKDKVNFVFVYVAEAHTEDGWQTKKNTQEKITYSQPKTIDEREAIASTCQSVLLLDMPIVLDAMDNAQGIAYSGVPNRAYLIDQGGKVLYRGQKGPQGSNPDGLLSALKKQFH